MTIAVVLDDARMRVAVLAGSLGALVDLDALGRKLRRKLMARTVYIVDGVRWVAEEEAIRLIARAGRDRLLVDLAAAIEQARRQAVNAIEEEARRLVTLASEALEANRITMDRIRALEERTAPEPEEPGDESRIWN